MLLLLMLLYPVIELYVLVRVGSALGVINTIFALIAMGVLGAGLARTQGRYILSKMQLSLARGQVPANDVIHGLLVFVGGVLFLIPGFVSDFAGLFLVLPGLRHLVVAYVKRKLEKKMSSGQFRVFTGFGGMGGMGGMGGPGGVREPGGPRPARDVSPKVIDITPLSSRTETRDSGDEDPNR